MNILKQIKYYKQEEQIYVQSVAYVNTKSYYYVGFLSTYTQYRRNSMQSDGCWSQMTLPVEIHSNLLIQLVSGSKWGKDVIWYIKRHN